MKELQLLNYIKKYRIVIVLSSLLMGVLFYSYFAGKQTYTASAIIQYKNEKAVEGLAADDTEIDVTEIYSTEVMAKVFEKLGLTYDENNIDAVRAGIRVEPIRNEEDATVQEALNEKGEVAEEKPTMYLVSYTVGNKDVQNAAGFSKEILTTMLNVYVETYAENHVNSAIPLYSVDGVHDQQYDYIEMAEVLDEAVSRAQEQLSYKTDTKFRSANTGYSFADLNQEFMLLKNIDIPNMYAYLLGNQITKDQDILLSKYENRIKNAILKNNKSDTESEGIDEIIASYVTMMRESKNVNFTYKYILGEVYENYQEGKEEGEESAWIKSTTEYDQLMNHYVEERTAFEETLIDIAYDQYILEVYSGNQGEENGVTVQAVENPKQATQAEQEEGEPADADSNQITFSIDTTKRKEIVSSKESKDTAYQMIKELTERVDALYQATLLTNQEYNRFAGAENIAIMTDAVTVPALNLLVYAALAVVLFGIIGCVMAIVVGRVLEIFDYFVYTDRELHIANRAGCDRYMAKFGRTMLPSDFICIAIKMTDIEERNKKYGRKQCDQMLKVFCETLRDVLSSEKTFIASNGVGQFVIFLEKADREQAHAYVREIGSRCISYNKENECKIFYTCGITSSEKSQIYDIKKLMIDAFKKASAAAIRKIS